jgi:hypothetical protein
LTAHGGAVAGAEAPGVVVAPAGRLHAAVAATVAAAIALVAPVPFLLPARLKLERGELWSFVLLVAMAGWGGLVERLTLGERRADLGLRIAWGAAALIAAGGISCLVSAATAPVALALVLGGVALTVVEIVRGRNRFGARVLAWLRLWPAALLLALVGIAGLTLVHVLTGAAGAHLNMNDDHAAYMIFPRKILATGTLLDPFSMRRITAYGGQSFLQALTIVGAASPLQLSLLDIGISLVMVLVLIVGAFDQRTPRSLRALAVLPALFVLTLPNIRVNSASELSGVVFFLALYRTAASPAVKTRPAGAAALLGLLAAGACTLRHSYLVPVAVFMVVFYLPAARAALRAALAERRRHLREIGWAAGILVLALLPWAVLAYRSNRTFLFPLFAGTYHVEYGGFTTHAKTLDRLKLLWLNICHCHPVVTIPFFLIAGMLIPWRRTQGALPALLWASFVGFVAVVLSVPLSTRWDLARYYYGFSVAAVLATMLAAFSRPWWTRNGRVRTRIVAPAALTIMAIVGQVQEAHGGLHPIIDDDLTLIDRATDPGSPLEDHGGSYRQLQATIPAGAPMLVMLDEAFWFDFRRNPINLVDLPGASSPAPGMPLDDDDRLAGYLGAQGYRYVAFVRPTASRSIYRRDLWNRKLASAPEPIWRLTAPFYLKAFDRFEGLAKSRKHLYDDGRMVALDLGTRAANQP